MVIRDDDDKIILLHACEAIDEVSADIVLVESLLSLYAPIVQVNSSQWQSLARAALPAQLLESKQRARHSQRGQF